MTATRDGADPVSFEATVRIDTPNEVAYFQNGGILHRVLRDLRDRASPAALPASYRAGLRILERRRLDPASLAGQVK